MPVQIDLSSNRLCGVYLEHGTWGKQMGTYDDKGIRAIAHAMGVSRSLTECNLRDNGLGKEGWCTIFDALHKSPQNVIAKWDLHNEGIDTEITKSLAAYMAVSRSLSKVLPPLF